MSRKGNCWDNAAAESFFKSLKVKWVIGRGIPLDLKRNYPSFNGSRLGTIPEVDIPIQETKQLRNLNYICIIKNQQLSHST